MSPSQFHDFHSKREIISNNNNNNITSLCPPPLKINKDSHFIKKSQSSSSSSSTAFSLVNSVGPAAAATKPQQQRHPVIIYTHSPKIIHIHPRHFMALVQKLTGLPRSEEVDGRKALPPPPPKQEPGSDDKEDSNDNKIKVFSNEDNETTSSVVTDDDDNDSRGSLGDNQVSSCFVANLPVFTPNPAEFLCSKQPLLNCTDSLFFSHRNMMTSIPHLQPWKW